MYISGDSMRIHLEKRIEYSQIYVIMKFKFELQGEPDLNISNEFELKFL